MAIVVNCSYTNIIIYIYIIVISDPSKIDRRSASTDISSRPTSQPSSRPDSRTDLSSRPGSRFSDQEDAAKPKPITSRKGLFQKIIEKGKFASIKFFFFFNYLRVTNLS